MQDLEAVRLVLRGGSVVDWHRLNFQTVDDARQFVRLNGFDPLNTADQESIKRVRTQAEDFLVRNFKFRLTRKLRSADSIEDLIILASNPSRWSRDQILACVLLKTMHLVQRIEAHHLLHEVAISEAVLFDEVERRIQRFARRVMDLDLPIVHFYGSRKSSDSVITKLFLKKETTVAQVMDRLRYRIVTEDRNAIPFVMGYLLRHLMPFNQVMPKESSNNLVDFRQFVEGSEKLRPLIEQFQLDIGLEEDEGLGTWPNRYSGSGYRMINFVMSIPVRLDVLPELAGSEIFGSHGPVVHVMTEFQIVDREGAYLNEQGANSHAAYKKRQRRGVKERLRWGVVRQRLAHLRERANQDAERSGASVLDSDEFTLPSLGSSSDMTPNLPSEDK